MRGYFFFAILSFASISGASQAEGLDEYVGLYKIVNANCVTKVDTYDPCKHTLFFEIVKGQFIGISNDEIGYVFWSGDPKKNPELQYSSHLVKDSKARKVVENRFYLHEQDDSEYLIFSSGKLKAFHAIYETRDKSKNREITYELKPVRRGNFPELRLNYPGNK